MFLAFHFREMEKVRGIFPSLSFPSVPSSALPKALDKEQRKNRERLITWFRGGINGQINACVLHWLGGHHTFGFEFEYPEQRRKQDQFQDCSGDNKQTTWEKHNFSRNWVPVNAGSGFIVHLSQFSTGSVKVKYLSSSLRYLSTRHKECYKAGVQFSQIITFLILWNYGNGLYSYHWTFLIKTGAREVQVTTLL